MDSSSKQDTSVTQPMRPKLQKTHAWDKDFTNVQIEENRESIMEAGSGTQLLEAHRYSEYMSYLPRNNKDIAIPTWELSEADLEKLSKEHIIAKDFTSDIMVQKIREIMYPIVDLILDGKEFSFSIPSMEDNIEYNSDLCFPLLKRGKFAKRNFYNLNCTHTAAMTAWVLKIIYENFKSGLVITLRDLYYRCSILFGKQTVSNGIITDICLMFGCTRCSLNLTSEKKGSVCGMLSIKLKDGSDLDCSDGIDIPDVSKIDCFIITESMDCIVVVEKGSIFNYLKRFLYHQRERCILMTANGFPNISSRSFLKRLQRDINLPIIGVADPDPSGLSIMKCYTQGSKNLAHENFNLAVPSLMWVGLSLIDIEDSGIQLEDHNSEKLTKRDKSLLDNLLNDEYMKLTPIWKAAVEKMRSVGRKTSFEIMHDKGFSYVADDLLPKLIRRARGIKEEPHKK